MENQVNLFEYFCAGYWRRFLRRFLPRLFHGIRHALQPVKRFICKRRGGNGNNKQEKQSFLVQRRRSRNMLRTRNKLRS